MNLIEEKFEKPGEIHSEIGEDIEMGTPSFECTKNLDLTKHSLHSWKRIIRDDMVLNSNQSSSLKLLSSKRHGEDPDPNHFVELHPHQKKQAIDPSDIHSFFPLTGVGTQFLPFSSMKTLSLYYRGLGILEAVLELRCLSIEEGPQAF